MHNLTHWLWISGWGICFQTSGWFHKGEILSPTGYNRWIWMGFQYAVDEVICFVIYCLAELSLVTLFIYWVTWAHNGYMKFAILNLHVLFFAKDSLMQLFALRPTKGGPKLGSLPATVGQCIGPKHSGQCS